jgi:hypothetical protein
MLKYFRFYLLLIAVLFSSSTIIQAQEQLTNFKGSPCCYDFEKILEYEGQLYGFAFDHQDGVKIYTLEEMEAELVFTNDKHDKVSLIDHGLLQDFYYFIYQDKIELFQFSDGSLEVYEFKDPLSINRSQKAAVSMSPYGLTVIPESDAAALQFYSLESQRFESRSPSFNRGYEYAQLDSFIIFYFYQQGQGKLFSHNIVSDEIYLMHTRDSSGIRFTLQNGLLFFGDRFSLFISNGHPDNTFILGDYRYYWTDIFTYKKGEEVHLVLEDDHQHYFQIDWSRGIVEDYKFDQDAVDVYIEQFYPINEDELLLFSSLYLTKVNMRTDSVSMTRVDHSSEFVLDSPYVYYDGSRLNSFNYNTEEEKMLSEIWLSRYIEDIRDLYKVNDSLFYLIGNNAHWSVDGKDGLFAFDIAADTIVEILSFGESGNGLSQAKLQKVGKKLLLRTKDQILEWTGQKFDTVFASDIELPLLHHKGKYYFVAEKDDLSISLYEWRDQKEIVRVADNIPYSYWRGHFMDNSDQLIAINGFLGAFSINTETGNYDTLSPYSREIILYDVYPMGKYIIMELRVPGRGNEFWSYNTELRSWVELNAKDFDKPMDISNPRNKVGEYTIQIEYDPMGSKVFGISLLTGEQVVLLDGSKIGSGSYRFRTLPSCDDGVNIHAINYDTRDEKLYATDGTIDGTQKILEYDPYYYLGNFYEFEDELYFTSIDSSSTKVFRLNCNDQIVEDQLWLDPLIPYQHIKVQDQKYIIGYQLYPQRNVSLNSVNGNSLEEILISPYIAKPDGAGIDAEPLSTINVHDSIVAFSASLDERGEELWFLYPNAPPERMTDLNEGPFDGDIDELIIFGEYLYFTGYQYGPGRQVWRMPLPFTIPPDHQQTLKLIIAPNPTDQFLNIYHMPADRGELNIMDISGKSIFRGIKKRGTYQFSFDMKPYPQGLYFVQLKTSDEKYFGKFILN